MKRMTCSEIGGVCEEKITGVTFDEVAKKGYDHIAQMTDEEHKKMKEMIDSSTDEQKQKWMEETKPKFDSALDE